MAAACTRYTLVGFSAALDWRPIRFVSLAPPSTICGACGLLRPVAARFPCQHVLCESCYELSAQGDHARVCPLDRLQCLDEDVGFQEMAADELLKTKVRCWNEQAGCDAVMPASISTMNVAITRPHVPNARHLFSAPTSTHT
ncbi:uncharacterized protein LOC144105006 [Amblyomma americanum]